MDPNSTNPMAEPALNSKRKGLLDWIEWLGNKLPDAAVLFLVGAIIVMIISHIGYTQGWSVDIKSLQEVVDPETGEATTELVSTGTEPLTARSLLTSDGLYWCLSTMVANFMQLPLSLCTRSHTPGFSSCGSELSVPSRVS